MFIQVIFTHTPRQWRHTFMYSWRECSCVDVILYENHFLQENAPHMAIHMPLTMYWAAALLPCVLFIQMSWALLNVCILQLSLVRQSGHSAIGLALHKELLLGLTVEANDNCECPSALTNRMCLKLIVLAFVKTLLHLLFQFLCHQWCPTFWHNAPEDECCLLANCQ